MGDVVSFTSTGQPATRQPKSIMERFTSDFYLVNMAHKPDGIRRLYDALVAAADAGMGMEALLETIANPFSETLEELIEDLNGAAMRLYEGGGPA